MSSDSLWRTAKPVINSEQQQKYGIRVHLRNYEKDFQIWTDLLEDWLASVLGYL